MSVLSKNIELIRHISGLSQEDFGKEIGITRHALYTYETGRTEPKSYVLARIAAFANLTIEDLMSKELTEGQVRNIEDYHHDVHDDKNATNEPDKYLVKPLYKDKVKGKALPETSIPVFNDGGSAGHAELYQDFKERPAGFIRVPGYEDCDFATYAYGHSMYPIIESGALILCRKTINKQMILWGEIYYIITSDHRLIKRLL